jgi:hypothetical protein
MFQKIIAVVKSIRFACPVTTSHREAHKQIENQHKQIERTMLSSKYSPMLAGRLVTVRQDRIAREESILSKPNRIEFPIFFHVKVGRNDFAVSLAGLRCNFPRLAQKYGTECEYAGNTLHYRNWLGHHWDF